MLQAILPLTTAGLAVLGLIGTGRGATAALVVLAAAALILLWSDVRFLLVGLRDLRALDHARGIGERMRAMSVSPVAIGTYPVGSVVTCIAVVGGVLLLGQSQDEALTPLVLGAVAGGLALRLLLGACAVALTMNHLPAALRDPLRDALDLH